MTKNANHISLIHNYCDRWCEKCTFTSRCVVYEKVGKFSEEELDANNEIFWKKISENFEDAIVMLKQKMGELGIKENDWKDIEMPANDEEIENHPLIKLCEKYANTNLDFFKDLNFIKTQIESINTNVKLGISSAEKAFEINMTINGYIQIINYFNFFILVKLSRALSGKLDEDSDSFYEENNLPKDSDGSAKIALISIEKSTYAWAKLYESFPEREDGILQCLSLLEQIKKMALIIFPNAILFKRPGFDD